LQIATDPKLQLRHFEKLRAASTCSLAIMNPSRLKGSGSPKPAPAWSREPPNAIIPSLDSGEAKSGSRSFSEYIPYGDQASAETPTKFLISLARPTGIEPVFPP
jgi:hypothetical protein